MARGVSLDGMRLVVAIARAGSITAAAQALGLAQASVSEQLASLEDQLGHALFVRTSHGVTATPRGQDLVARVTPAVDSLVAELGLDPHNEQVDTLHVAGPAAFLSQVIVPGLALDSPSRRLSVQFGLAREVIDAVAEGSVDVGVSTIKPHQPGLAHAPIHDELFDLVGAGFAPGPVTMLESLPLLAYSPDLPIIRRYWWSVFDRSPAQLEAATVVPDLRVLADLAVAGAGITVLPRYLVAADLAAGRLQRLHEPQTPPLNTLYVVTRSTDQRGAVQRLRDQVAAVAGRLGP